MSHAILIYGFLLNLDRLLNYKTKPREDITALI